MALAVTFKKPQCSSPRLKVMLKPSGLPDVCVGGKSELDPVGRTAMEPGVQEAVRRSPE